MIDHKFHADRPHTAGAVLLGVGGLTLRRTTRGSDIPYASIPVSSVSSASSREVSGPPADTNISAK